MRAPETKPTHEYLLDIIKLFGRELRTFVAAYVDMLLSLPENISAMMRYSTCPHTEPQPAGKIIEAARKIRRVRKALGPRKKDSGPPIPVHHNDRPKRSSADTEPNPCRGNVLRPIPQECRQRNLHRRRCSREPRPRITNLHKIHVPPRTMKIIHGEKKPKGGTRRKWNFPSSSWPRR